MREELEGPSVEIAYGGTRRVLKVLFSAEAMSLLVREIGFVAKKGGLWDYLAGQDGGVLDLMDLCDRKGIPYVFSSTGDGGDCQFRPVG